MSEDLQHVSGVAMRPDGAVLARFPEVYGRTEAERVVALARGLTASPGWQPLRSRARIVVRADPAPVVAVIGRFEPQDRPLLDALGWQVPETLGRLRPASYDDVERHCADLATQLTEHLGADGLATCRMVGLPRGGLIVAGLLAYVLGLSHEQLSADAGGGPLVVVDDCMLSGARLRRWLRATAARDVVVAHLHSHPDARAAVERDAAVTRCLAAVDLRDHAPQLHGDAYPQWRQRWADRSPDDFMTGHLDHVCFPWNEPDTLIFNDRRDRAEPGWRVVPPEWCLKNRSAAGDAADVQACVPPAGTVRPAPTVLWADVDGSVVAFDATGGTAVQLEGVAADFFKALIATGDPAAAARMLEQDYAVSAERLRGDLDGFVAALVARGLIEQAG